MLMGKSPSSNNYQKLCRKLEMGECHCKTRHRQQENKSNQSVKVIRTFIQNREPSFRSYVKDDLVP